MLIIFILTPLFFFKLTCHGFISTRHRYSTREVVRVPFLLTARPFPLPENV